MSGRLKGTLRLISRADLHVAPNAAGGIAKQFMLSRLAHRSQSCSRRRREVF